MSQLKIGFFEFLVFALYYVVLKVLVQVLNLEARRNGYTTLAGVAGIFA